MNSMNKETFSRFVLNLSARYDEKAMNAPPLVRTGAYNANLPSVYEPECIYSLPCLSLRTNENARRRAAQPGEIDHDNLQRLLSRSVQYSKSSVASSSLLRNLVSSFGHILELEIQQRLYNVMEKLEKCKESEAKRHRNEAIYKAFEEQSLSNESPAVPVSAYTTFCTVVPVKDWAQQSKHQEGNTMDILFEAKIRLRLNPNCALITCRLKAPGKVTVMSQSKSGNLESLDVRIDTGVLCNSITRECKYIAKQIIRSIVGFDMSSEKKPKSNRKDSEEVKQDAASIVGPSSVVASDSVTRSTVASAEDSIMEDFRKKAIGNAPAAITRKPKTSPSTDVTNGTESFESAPAVKVKKKEKERSWRWLPLRTPKNE